jgi:hypothetical protein
MRGGANFIRQNPVRVLPALACGAFALSAVSSAAESTFQPPAIYECLDRSAMTALEDGMKRDSRFAVEQMENDTISEGIWQKCSRQHPGDASQVDRKAAASLVGRAVTDWLGNGGGIRADPMPPDIYVALDLYENCLTQNALGFAAVSDEPAETIVKAAFAACKVRQAATYAAYLDRGEHLDDEVLAHFEGDIEKDMVKDILNERIRQRFRQGEVPQSSPARHHESPL